MRILRNQERKWFIYSEKIDKKAQQFWYKKYLQTENGYMFAVSEVKRPNIFVEELALYNFNSERKASEFGPVAINHNYIYIYI